MFAIFCRETKTVQKKEPIRIERKKDTGWGPHKKGTSERERKVSKKEGRWHKFCFIYIG